VSNLEGFGRDWHVPEGYGRELSEILEGEGVTHQGGNLWYFRGSFYFLSDDGGEVQIERVNDSRLLVSLPYQIDGGRIVEPVEMAVGVKQAMALFESGHDNPRDDLSWQVEWVNWVRSDKVGFTPERKLEVV
jgi:hypothetical protein